MENKNILISGAGIAGLTLAYWLKKHGFNPTIIEISPILREGGYVIDFFGAGYDVAEKMGITSDLKKEELLVDELTFVDKDNKRKGGLNIDKMKKLLSNKLFNIRRSALAKVIHKHLDKDIEYIFGNSISLIEQDENLVTVTLRNGEIKNFDLLIGADGLHSTTRKLTFGKESQFEKFYGCYASSFTIENYLQTKNCALSYTAINKQVTVYTVDNNKLVAFFIFKADSKLNYDHHNIEIQKEFLRKEFGELPWECKTLLDKMDSASDFYFDSVSQIQMNNWSKGRVSLVGDACDCPSLLSGQGSTLAMVGAYILAGELSLAKGDYQLAFNGYEKEFKPFIEGKQKIAQSFANSFVPSSNFGIWARNTFTNFLFLPILSKWFLNKFMIDRIKLKSY